VNLIPEKTAEIVFSEIEVDSTLIRRTDWRNLTGS